MSETEKKTFPPPSFIIINNYSLDILILTWYCWCAVIFYKLKFKCWGFYEVLDLEEESSHPPSYALPLVDQVELVHKLVQVVRRLHHASQQRHQCNIISLSLSLLSSSLSSLSSSLSLLYHFYYDNYLNTSNSNCVGISNLEGAGSR